VLRDTGRDDGSITVLIIGFTAIAAVLVVMGIDISKVFLAQRALASAADAAAIAAAQGVDTERLYASSGPVCGHALHLDESDAAQRAQDSLAGERRSLDHVFASLQSPQTTVDGGTAEVRLNGRVAVPFGKVLAWLDPGRSDGLVKVSETSSARSLVAGGSC
jgi:Putative Flp pilus-assembly TadE/G-like